MDNGAFQLDRYVERIGYSGLVQPTEDRLEALHRAQVYTIPFENFDILLGRGVSLEPAAVFEKLVRRPRGGYCFELNALFLSALRAFGFDARPLLARVHLSGEPSGRSHQLSLVSINGREWIADVGFGSQTLRAAIPLELNCPVTQDRQTFRLIEAERFGVMLQLRKDDQWQDLYSFDYGHVFPNDIAVGNHFTSTHPGSFFTFARVASLPMPDGIATLHNLTLTMASAGNKEVRELEEGQPFLDALRTSFGIELDATYDRLRSIPG